MLTEIKHLIGQDQIEQVIARLEENQALISENQLLIFKNKWQALQSKQKIGALTDEAFSAEKTKWLQSLLWLLEPGSIDIDKIRLDLEALSMENAQLKKDIAFYRDKEDNYNGYKFKELFERFSQKWFTIDGYGLDYLSQFYGRPFDEKMELIAQKKQIDLNELLIVTRKGIDGQREYGKSIVQSLFDELLEIGLIEFEGDYDNVIPQYTAIGRKYLLELIKQSY